MADRRSTYEDVRPVRDLVTDEECYEAMHFWDVTAHDYAMAEADFERLQEMVSVMEAQAALLSDEKSADMRKYDARTSPAYLQRLEEKHQARSLFLSLRNKIAVAKIKIEIWRTIHADKRNRDVPEPGRR